MKLSAKTEYACIAVLELAASYGSGEPIRIRTIAEQHGVPQRFLVQILLQLKAAGIVGSTRGQTGGYQLLKAPEEISLADVIDVIEGAQEAELTSNASQDSAAARVILEAWRRSMARQREVLRHVTFADLASQLRRHVETMYYI